MRGLLLDAWEGRVSDGSAGGLPQQSLAEHYAQLIGLGRSWQVASAIGSTGSDLLDSSSQAAAPGGRLFLRCIRHAWARGSWRKGLGRKHTTTSAPRAIRDRHAGSEADAQPVARINSTHYSVLTDVSR